MPLTEPETRQKQRIETAIESAFIKGATRVNLLQIGAPDSLLSHFPASQRLTIRLEVDTDPPSGADYEVRTQLVPIPFQVRLFTLPCLFAGKLHVILCRNWKSRVKGRDYYDLMWYLGRNTPVALPHLRQRMEQTGHWQPGHPLDLARLKELLRQRFEAVDFNQAKDDVRPFVRDPDELALWSQEFFTGLMDRLRDE